MVVSGFIGFLVITHAIIAFGDISGLSDLNFGGIGSRKKTNNNYEYQFSDGFQNQICGDCPHTNCWGVQGVSKYGDYITRSLYQMGSATGEKDCNGKDTLGYAYCAYSAIVVMKRDTQKYSNILLEMGEECHAGDHVIRKIDGVYYFLVACTKFVAIFSEQDIIKDTRFVNNKKFYYLVLNENIMKRNHSAVSFSYISRNDGEVTQYIAGAYSQDSTTAGLNLNIIDMNMNTNWDISVVKAYTVKSAVAKKVQGATRIGNYMYLTTSTEIRRCTTTNDEIYNCHEQCKIQRSCPGRNLVLQGAETDSNGDLYIGTEFGGGSCGKPWFEINSVSDDSSGYCMGSSVPFIDSIENDNHEHYSIGVDWNYYESIGRYVIAGIVMYLVGICNYHCWFVKGKQSHYASVKVMSSADEDI